MRCVIDEPIGSQQGPTYRFESVERQRRRDVSEPLAEVLRLHIDRRPCSPENTARRTKEQQGEKGPDAEVRPTRSGEPHEPGRDKH